MFRLCIYIYECTSLYVKDIILLQDINTYHFRKLSELRALVTQNENLKKQEQEFKSQCKVCSYFPKRIIISYLEIKTQLTNQPHHNLLLSINYCI